MALDHVNAHKHFHLHPTIARHIITIGARYGMKGLRVPIEPKSVLSKVESVARHGVAAAVAGAWAKLLARRVRRANIRTADAVFGLAWSGAMTTSRLTGLIEHLPAGSTEIYLHPATGGDFPGHATGYRYTDELRALMAREAMAAARRAGTALGGYADIRD